MDEPNKLLLNLCVTGQTATARRASHNLERICDEELHGRYALEVIDIAEHPQLAEDERTLAIPLLIEQLPSPLRRLSGDLSDREQVLLGLDVRPEDGGGEVG